MIKIIEHGKKKRYGRKFCCLCCECVYVATREDYHSVIDPLEQDIYYRSYCPDCGMDNLTRSDENVVVIEDD